MHLDKNIVLYMNTNRKEWLHIKIHYTQRDTLLLQGCNKCIYEKRRYL